MTSPARSAALVASVVALGGVLYLSRSKPPPEPAPAPAAPTSASAAPVASAVPSGDPFPTLAPETPEQLQEVATYTRQAGPDDVAELQRATRESESAVVVGESLIALSRLQALTIDDEFKEFLKDPRPRVRNDAIVALGMSGDPHAIEILTGLLDPEQPQVRAVALGALRRIGSAEAKRIIAEALADPKATALDRRLGGEPP
jgi:HEAT repeat protein